MASGKCLSDQNGPPGNLSSVVFLKDHVLACGTNERAVCVWDAVTGHVRGPKDAADGIIESLGFSADGRSLFSLDSTRNLQRWRVASGEQAGSSVLRSVPRNLFFPPFPEPAGVPAREMLSPYGKYALLIEGPGRTGVRLKRAETGGDVCRLSMRCHWRLHGSFSRDGRLFVLGGGNPDARPGKIFSALERSLRAGNRSAFPTDLLEATIIELCQSETGKIIRRFKGLNAFIEGVALSPDGRLVAATGTSLDLEETSHETSIWEADSGKQLARFAIPARPQMFDFGPALLFSPDGSWLVTRETEGELTVRAARTGAPVCVLPNNGETRPLVACFSPDGRVLAVAGDRSDTPSTDGTTIRLWELASTSVRREFTGHAGNVPSLCFSDDGRLLASGSADTTILLWDVGRHEQHPTRLEAKEAEKLWRDLGSTNAAQAYEAVLRLSSAGEDALALLRSKLRPAAPAPAERELKRLASQLDSPRFAEREAAAAALRAAGKAVIPVLQDLLKRRPSTELGQRSKKIIDEVDGPDLPNPDLQSVRALEVLENLNTRGARAVVETLAQGRAGARRTREAKAVLARMGAAR